MMWGTFPIGPRVNKNMHMHAIRLRFRLQPQIAARSWLAGGGIVGFFASLGKIDSHVGSPIGLERFQQAQLAWL